jgi:uncharacterized protein YbjT (DUF2867 family)
MAIAKTPSLKVSSRRLDKRRGGRGPCSDSPGTAAVRGCAAVVSAVHGFVGPGKPSPEAIDRDGNRALIRAAAAAGLERVVLVSVLGAAPDHPMSLHRAKYAAEQALRASGLQWTIMRPTSYLETWTAIIGARLADGSRALVFGPGRNPINFVSAHDVAALVDLAVRDHALRGQILEVAGPQNLSFVAMAERLIAATGAPGRIRHIPLQVLRAMSVLARPVSPALARQAQAAVVMNTIDMTVDVSAMGDRLPIVPTVTLDDVLGRQRVRNQPGAAGGAERRCRELGWRCGSTAGRPRAGSAPRGSPRRHGAAPRACRPAGRSVRRARPGLPPRRSASR